MLFFRNNILASFCTREVNVANVMTRRLIRGEDDSAVVDANLYKTMETRFCQKAWREGMNE